MIRLLLFDLSHYSIINMQIRFKKSFAIAAKFVFLVTCHNYF